MNELSQANPAVSLSQPRLSTSEIPISTYQRHPSGGFRWPGDVGAEHGAGGRARRVDVCAPQAEERIGRMGF